MKSPSKAFENYKQSSQAHIDFVVIVCHAVPALRADIALTAPDLTYSPDYFKKSNNPKDWVAAHVDGYTDELARSTLLTVFSYFEGYVKDVLKEIVAFHGGEKLIQSRARTRSERFVHSASPEIIKNKRKLQDNHEPRKKGKYQKFGRLLDAAGFRFPTDLLSNFGVRFLISKLDKNKGMRAYEIPMILSDCLLFRIEDAETKMFNKARDLRNELAHGNPRPIPLATALRYASELHTLAAKVDKHICEHFFVIQPD